MCFSYQRCEVLYFPNETFCYKKSYPKVLTFPFAEDLVIQKLNFLKVIQEKDRCFCQFNFKNDHLYHERLVNSKIFLSHLTKKSSIIFVS